MATSNEKIHALALKRFERIQQKEKNQRRLAVEDIRFAQAEDGQWDDDSKEKRKNRPRFTINRVAGAVDQLIGDQRQNRTNIKVRPVSGGATESVAKTLTGIIRNIEDISKANNAYDTAFDEGVNGGFGGWRVTTEFSDDDVFGGDFDGDPKNIITNESFFNQDIKIVRLKAATTSLWFDDAAIEYDKRDSNFAFVTVGMPKEEHNEKFPHAPISGWPQDRYTAISCINWVNDNSVRVAEYWVKTPITKHLALLSDGRVCRGKRKA